MAPPSADSIPNVGSVHLTSMVVLSNPRPSDKAKTVFLDLHLLLDSPDGDVIEKTILVRLYNEGNRSFEAPRVCFVSSSVCLHSFPDDLM